MSDSKIKLIWDLRGGDAKGTAEHHVIHLKEYAEREAIPLYGCDIEIMSDMYVVAFMIVDESNMIQVRDDLRPHRGTRVEN